MPQKILRIGAGSAWWGDRIEPAQWNAERGALDYLCFETMAESTISAAQVRARRDPAFPGYDTYLDDRLAAVLPACLAQGTRIISNQGWINPQGAAERAAWWCRKLGRTGVRIAAVTGGMLGARVLGLADRILETGAPLAALGDSIVSAEAYLGAEPIAAALAQGAQIVLTGRVADPSLFLAPMMHEFGWRAGDGRILRRSRLQGRAGALEPGISDRRGRGGWQRRHHQASRHRRRGRFAHGQRAALLRGA